MTNKEAYEFIQTLFLPREVMEICLKALEKADKYRWHDLYADGTWRKVQKSSN